MTTNARVAILAALATLDKKPELREQITMHIPKSGRSVSIIHRRKHVPTVVFAWSNDHFIVYFLDDAGVRQRALMSIWNASEAKTFVRWYRDLVALGARRRPVEEAVTK